MLVTSIFSFFHNVCNKSLHNVVMCPLVLWTTPVDPNNVISGVISLNKSIYTHKVSKIRPHNFYNLILIHTNFNSLTYDSSVLKAFVNDKLNRSQMLARKRYGKKPWFLLFFQNLLKHFHFQKIIGTSFFHKE